MTIHWNIAAINPMYRGDQIANVNGGLIRAAFHEVFQFQYSGSTWKDGVTVNGKPFYLIIDDYGDKTKEILLVHIVYDNTFLYMYFEADYIKNYLLVNLKHNYKTKRIYKRKLHVPPFKKKWWKESPIFALLLKVYRRNFKSKRNVALAFIEKPNLSEIIRQVKPLLLNS